MQYLLIPKKNSKSAGCPQAVIKKIECLRKKIVITRKRRKETQAQWAKKLEVSEPRMVRIGRSDSSELRYCRVFIVENAAEKMAPTLTN